MVRYAIKSPYKVHKNTQYMANQYDQLMPCVCSAMKLGTIWKEAHSHFHGTCNVCPMQSVNITLVTHAFSCDTKDVWSEVMQRYSIHVLLVKKNKQKTPRTKQIKKTPRPCSGEMASISTVDI